MRDPNAILGIDCILAAYVAFDLVRTFKNWSSAHLDERHRHTRASAFAVLAVCLSGFRHARVLLGRIFLGDSMAGFGV